MSTLIKQNNHYLTKEDTWLSHCQLLVPFHWTFGKHYLRETISWHTYGFDKIRKWVFQENAPTPSQPKCPSEGGGDRNFDSYYRHGDVKMVRQDMQIDVSGTTSKEHINLVRKTCADLV